LANLHALPTRSFLQLRRTGCESVKAPLREEEPYWRGAHRSFNGSLFCSFDAVLSVQAMTRWYPQ
jgi:hypothetical protein